jgi:hypothetical protein
MTERVNQLVSIACEESAPEGGSRPVAAGRDCPLLGRLVAGERWFEQSELAFEPRLSLRVLDRNVDKAN